MSEEQFEILTTYLKNIQSNTTNTFADKVTANKEILEYFKQILVSIGSLNGEVRGLMEEVRSMKVDVNKDTKKVVKTLGESEVHIIERGLTLRGIISMILRRGKNGTKTTNTKETTPRKS